MISKMGRLQTSAILCVIVILSGCGPQEMNSQSLPESSPINLSSDKYKLIDRLLDVSGLRTEIVKIQLQGRASFEAFIAREISDLPEVKKQHRKERDSIVEAFQRDERLFIPRILSDEYLDAIRKRYSRNFTVRQLQQAIAFFQSDAGKAFVKSGSVFDRDAFQRIVESANSIEPQTRALAAEMRSKIQPLRQSHIAGEQ
jgi:hypothetical protein